MVLHSLKSKLLAAVSVLVIGSGVLISLFVTNRYGDSLLSSATAQAESLAHAVALESTDKILVNDLVALQKMLDHQMRSNPSLAYLMVVRNGRILAHTFSKGVPADLLGANQPTSGDAGRVRQIRSTDGENYVDIAWPIFSRNAGVLRLGMSEKPLKQQVNRLWWQMSLVTLGILLLAVAGSLIFVKRITRPLAALAGAARAIQEGDLNIEVPVEGNDEVSSLAASFNEMISKIKNYTTRLEAQHLELEHTHNQTRTFCEIIREIGELPTLPEIGQVLIRRLQAILSCDQAALLILNENRDVLFVVAEERVDCVRDPEQISATQKALQTLKELTFTPKQLLRFTALPKDLLQSPLWGIVRFQAEGRTIGGLIVACGEDFRCDIKGIDVARLILAQSAGVIRRAIAQAEEIDHLQKRLEASAEFSGIVGKDPKMQVIYRLIEDIARTDATALIQGESGTGKELVARAIHQRSARKEKRFVVINCSAYPDTLLESELFGHEQGAFTGAIRRRAGRFEQADGGTVFLDEIAEIPATAQIKLLRVIQTQKFERLGGEKTLAVDVRMIAATNKDLLEEVKAGRFREDLYYRLNVIPISLPSLRERPNDIPLLAKHFLQRFAAQQQMQIQEFSPEAMRLMLDYTWPGNVRELENSVEHAVVLAKGSQIEVADLPAGIRRAPAAKVSPTVSRIADSEKMLLEKALTQFRWNKKAAARHLGIGRSTLYAKLRKHRISKPTIQ